MPGRRPNATSGIMAVSAALTLAASACGGDGDESKRPGTPTSAAPTSAAPPGTPTPSEPRGFQASIKKVTAADLKYSWRKGCPVAPSGLRMIQMSYWGMDHRTHPDGRLVVNASAAGDLVKVFRRLYDIRYPIRRMEPVDVYKGSDFASIEADNTSAFNCRPATGSSHWSQHAYGLAVDLNTCENPYVGADGHIEHKDCVKYGNRKNRDPGVVHAGDKVVKAFASIGWGWGGDWPGPTDYQHFSSTGR